MRGRSCSGTFGGVPVAVMKGRAHLYEGHPPQKVVFGVRVLGRLGMHSLVLTNACGALDAGRRPRQPRRDLGPPEPPGHVAARRAERRVARAALPRHVGRVRPGVPRARACSGRASRPPARRGGLRRLARACVRDAGGDPDDPHARRRPRRNVDGAGGPRGAPHGDPLPRALVRDERRRGRARRADRPRDACSRSERAPRSTSSRSSARSSRRSAVRRLEAWSCATFRRSTGCSATRCSRPRRARSRPPRPAPRSSGRARRSRRASDPGDPVASARAELERLRTPSLRRVLNATGVIVHTNLGRAPLPVTALERVVEVGAGYSNLELDLESGERGSRQDHVADSLRRLTGAEAALVVNNNAAAVLLALAALAEGREVVVSRGELVAIGDGFRIPDVLARSGARMVEVGTTNRTIPTDYERAIGPDTAALLRVHQSNYRIVGFAAAVATDELAADREAGRSAARRRPRLRLAARPRRRADCRFEHRRGRRPRLLLRRQAARRAPGGHRRRPRRPRRAPATASAPARAPRRQADARRARGHACPDVRPGDGAPGDPRAPDARRAARGRRGAGRAAGGPDRRGGRGDRRPRGRRARCPLAELPSAACAVEEQLADELRHGRAAGRRHPARRPPAAGRADARRRRGRRGCARRAPGRGERRATAS